MATRRSKSEESLPPPFVPGLTVISPFRFKRETTPPSKQEGGSDMPTSVADLNPSSVTASAASQCQLHPLSSPVAALFTSERSPVTPLPQEENVLLPPPDDRYLVVPVFAKTIDSSVVSYDVPAVRIYRASDGATLAVYPLDREQLGEVWNTDKLLRDWVFDTLPTMWNDAQRKFLPLVEYPFEYLQALLTVLRTQQFTDRTLFSNDQWKRACRRPLTLITITKPCSSCGILRQFAARTLLTAPSSFPVWKCSHLGITCGADENVTIFTVPPEQ